MPKIITPLITASIARALAKNPQGARLELRDGACPGLVLRASHHDPIWSLLTTHSHTRKRIPLGTYPQTSLAQARQKAQEARNAFREGSHSPALPALTLATLMTIYAEARRIKTCSVTRTCTIRSRVSTTELATSPSIALPSSNLQITMIKLLSDYYHFIT
jgi:hypothetical protein